MKTSLFRFATLGLLRSAPKAQAKPMSMVSSFSDADKKFLTDDDRGNVRDR